GEPRPRGAVAGEPVERHHRRPRPPHLHGKRDAVHADPHLHSPLTGTLLPTAAAAADQTWWCSSTFLARSPGTSTTAVPGVARLRATAARKPSQVATLAWGRPYSAAACSNRSPCGVPNSGS